MNSKKDKEKIFNSLEDAAKSKTERRVGKYAKKDLSYESILKRCIKLSNELQNELNNLKESDPCDDYIEAGVLNNQKIWTKK